MITRHQPHGLVVDDAARPTAQGEIRPAPHAGAAITGRREAPPRALGRLIKDRRRELGWSQEALAARVVAQGDGTFRQSDVSRLELGKVDFPRRERLRHIAAALGLSLGELLAASGWDGAQTAFAPPAPVLASRAATEPAPEAGWVWQRLRTAIAQAQATRCETRALLARSRALRERLAGPQPLRAGVVPLAALPAGAEPDGQVA
jgi:transcriptional regulator with XRE-family HTH domain